MMRTTVFVIIAALTLFTRPVHPTAGATGEKESLLVTVTSIGSSSVPFRIKGGFFYLIRDGIAVDGPDTMLIQTPAEFRGGSGPRDTLVFRAQGAGSIRVEARRLGTPGTGRIVKDGTRVTVEPSEVLTLIQEQ